MRGRLPVMLLFPKLDCLKPKALPDRPSKVVWTNLRLLNLIDLVSLLSTIGSRKAKVDYRRALKHLGLIPLVVSVGCFSDFLQLPTNSC